jgi:hypothetical protein
LICLAAATVTRISISISRRWSWINNFFFDSTELGFRALILRERRCESEHSCKQEDWDRYRSRQ